MIAESDHEDSIDVEDLEKMIAVEENDEDEEEKNSLPIS